LLTKGFKLVLVRTMSASSDGNEVAYSYDIIHIPHDEAGIRRHLEEYKAFRLLSLQLAPDAFVSSYARESAFDDETWYGRLSNAGANTFMALRKSGQVLRTATVLGPLPYGTDGLPSVGNPWTAIGGEAGLDDLEFLHFRFNAIFTLPEARRRGISKALIAKSIEQTQIEARSTSEKDAVFSVIVEADNGKARALYESAGFVQMKKFNASENPYERAIIILEYQPYGTPSDAVEPHV
jgi:ribosomal protein S18 acetylase RimI-like enzyme